MINRKIINGIGEIERSVQKDTSVKCKCGRHWVHRVGKKCIECVRERKNK